jgi:hypothetical protein
LLLAVAAIFTFAFIVVRIIKAALRLIIFIFAKPIIVTFVLDLNKAVFDDNHENALDLTDGEENIDVRE